MARSKQKFNIYREGKLHVMSRMCDTCIFRPGNLMHLRDGQVERMVAGSVAEDASIPCHETLGGDNAVCHGFFKLHKTTPLWLAQSMGVIAYVEPSDPAA